MITGIILAGGASSRMGRDKARLPVGSHLLIDVVLRRLRPRVDRLLVIGNAENVRELRYLPVDAVLTDVRPARGPLMGLYTGLMHSETDWNLCVPCDMPWIDDRLLARLLAHRRAWVALVASLHPVDGPQPFPLLCRTGVCRTIGALLDSGERALQVLLRCPEARLVRVEEPELLRSFANLNTAAQYDEFIHDHTLALRF